MAELYQALENNQIARNTNATKSPPLADTLAYVNLDSDTMGRLYAASLDIDSEIDVSLSLLSQTINSLEADIEDRLFAVWQGIAIRQVGDDFYGHLVPLDLIHELGFQSMPMAEFLDYLANVEAPDLELVTSNQDPNYTVGNSLAWSLTFHNHTKH